jgi:hypothetical protein
MIVPVYNVQGFFSHVYKFKLLGKLHDFKEFFFGKAAVEHPLL